LTIITIMSLQEKYAQSTSTTTPESSRMVENPEDSNDLDHIQLVPTNPPLRIMTGRQRRIKGATNQKRKRKLRQQHGPNLGEIRGLAAVLVAVAIFVVLEVILVDQLFLGSGGRIANVELHVSTAHVFVADIVEAGLNRYRPGGKSAVKLLTILHRGVGVGGGDNTEGIVPTVKHESEDLAEAKTN
jgi:hypothetical protein